MEPGPLGTESAERPPGIRSVSWAGTACGSLERNFNLVCGGHVGSFFEGDVGRTELGLVCIWSERGGGEIFHKEEPGQRPGGGIGELS